MQHEERDMTWQIRNLSVRYKGCTERVLHGITCDLGGAALLAFIGPNGAGKSTLVRALLGTMPIEEGSVALDGKPVQNWERNELACRVSVLPQGEEETFAMSTREVVAMGRYPHIGPWRTPSAADRSAVDGAMNLCSVTELAHRPMRSLSGGERQRVRIARAVAQNGSALVLDEPTASLDLSFEMEIFELMQSVARQGRTVIVVTHNVNLAARYANALFLLQRGQLVASGAPHKVMSSSLLEDVYRWPISIHPHAGPGRDSGAPQLVTIAADVTSDAASAATLAADRATEPIHMRGIVRTGALQ